MSRPPNRFSRLLWMVAQAGAIGAGIWLSFFAEPRPAEPMPPLAYVLIPFCWVLLVAFATGLITKSWDFALRKISGRPAPIRQGEEPGREQLGILGAFARPSERAKVGERGRIG
ncbi:hypothetical protein SAMN05192565_107143 [Methylobacterium gossipiicola]|uniref:Uncharacterized protein n=1 Tax=Methylobacterium gossipiicola TaxID=582675 RepID=A0A1I2TIZ1_9HYPH|nr:hypothetical protein SAMN05192565_107143 [Methylobacterium gossipiicola]